MKIDQHTHLSYCSNVHPGHNWEAHFTELQKHLPAIKEIVSPRASFGVGLRLSALATDELSQPEHMQTFMRFLSQHDLYVFTINGFPYAAFHETAVKEKVYLPDWRSRKRLEYSNKLASLLSTLAPNKEFGSISTVPIGFAKEINWEQDGDIILEHLLQHIAYLYEIYIDTGKQIALAIEPEPACYLETIQQTTDFFIKKIRRPAIVERFAKLTGSDNRTALQILNRHLGICLDLCHAAVEYEDPVDILDQLQQAEILIGKIQISAGLQLNPQQPQALNAIKAFNEPVYLHQTVARYDKHLQRFTDLGDALQQATDASEWRIHFHVPVFMDSFGLFTSTQAFTQKILLQQKNRHLTHHLEVETYTWNVLPDSIRSTQLSEAIAQELNWARKQLSTCN